MKHAALIALVLLATVPVHKPNPEPTRPAYGCFPIYPGVPIICIDPPWWMPKR